MVAEGERSPRTQEEGEASPRQPTCNSGAPGSAGEILPLTSRVRAASLKKRKTLLHPSVAVTHPCRTWGEEHLNQSFPVFLPSIKRCQSRTGLASWQCDPLQRVLG